MTVTREELSLLGAQLAEASEELVIAGEGNLSGSALDGSLLVSPSGYRLSQIEPGEWVDVDGARLVGALGIPRSDSEWLSEILESRRDRSALRPTVEVALHAVIAAELGPGYIAHTHPTALLSILCSPTVMDYASTRLFPDHAVMLGPADCVIPYTDPGQDLARVTQTTLRRHGDQYGEAPRLILAINHGIFVHGATPVEVLDRTRMAVKTARVSLGAAAAGGVQPMSTSDVNRILGREDEDYRRKLLADN